MYRLWFALMSHIVNVVTAKIIISMRMPSLLATRPQAFVAKALRLVALQARASPRGPTFARSGISESKTPTGILRTQRAEG